jgi:hypothetical protein
MDRISLEQDFFTYLFLEDTLYFYLVQHYFVLNISLLYHSSVFTDIIV